MRTQMIYMLKYVEVCRVSYLETFCEKKILEKLTGEKLQGEVAATPLGCIRDMTDMTNTT